MNQTSLVGRPLYQMAKSVARYVEKRSQWYGPVMSSSSEMGTFFASGSPASTGMHVNESTAYTYSVFWACVNNISTDIGSFPLNFYKTEPDGGKTPLRDHKLFPLLHDAPNPEMTAFTFRGVLTSNALTYGMGYAEVVRDGAGRPISLWPITPNRVTIRRNANAPYNLYYEVTRENGLPDMLMPDQMFVLPGSTYDGVYGRNIVNLARESIGLGLAAERFGGTFYGNGSTFGGVFEHPGTMTPLAQKNFRDSVNASHQGVERAHKFIIAEEGMKFQRLTVDQNAAQFIETRQHQIEEMCRWFRMPPHKVQHLIRTSYNSVEQMNIEYSTDTLTPWCVRWEQELLRQLIAPSERRIQFFKHNMDSKLRGDTASRYEAYTKGIQNGFLSADDVREKEDMNPLPDGAGKKYFLQSNTQPLDRVDEIIDEQVAPDPKPVAPAPEPKAKDDDEDRMRQVAAQILEAVHQQDVRIAAAMEQVNLSVAKRDEDAAVDVAAWRDELDAAREERGKLQVLLIDATAHADQLAAAKEAARVEAEAAAVELAQNIVAAQAERDAVKVAAEQERARLEAEAVLLRTQLDGVTAEREAFRETYETTAEQAGALAGELQTAREDIEAMKKVTLEATARLQAELAETMTLAEQLTTQRDSARAAALDAEQGAFKLQSDLVVAVEDANAKAATDSEAARILLEEEAGRVATEQAARVKAEADAAALRLVAETAAEDAKAAKVEARAAETAVESHRVETEKVTAAVAAQLEAERQARADVEAALTARQKADAVRMQALLTVHRDLILDAMARLIWKETERARKNKGTPAKLKAWAESFYLLHEDTCVDALRTVMRTHLVFIGSTVDVDVYTRGLIQPQLKAAVSQLRAVADGDQEDFPVAIERLLTRWETDRPAAVADAVLQEEVTYVRSL